MNSPQTRIRRVGWLVTLLWINIAQAQPDAGIQLPQLPTQVLAMPKTVIPASPTVEPITATHQGSHAAPGQSINTQTQRLVSMRSSSKTFDITVKPGINQVVPIALGHINRIVTPFDEPFVNTVSDATIEANENVLYIATRSEEPISLFIKPEAGDESYAISLTLAPKRIPPVQATLSIAESLSAPPVRPSKTAQRWEETQPYVAALRDLLHQLALKTIPNGYSLNRPQGRDELPTCLQPGMQFNFRSGQYLRGHHFVVAIGTAHNTSGRALEFNETQCVNGSILAVASWPHTRLKPDQHTEVFVVMEAVQPVRRGRARRSLIQGRR